MIPGVITIVELIVLESVPGRFERLRLRTVGNFGRFERLGILVVYSILVSYIFIFNFSNTTIEYIINSNSNLLQGSIYLTVRRQSCKTRTVSHILYQTMFHRVLILSYRERGT